jgi:CRP-like cAMP-binding protein
MTILSGWAIRYRLTADGRRQILEFLLAGDLVAFPGAEEDAPSTKVEAATNIRVCVFPSVDVQAFTETRSDGAQALQAMLRRTLAGYQLRVVDLGRRTGYERVASFLLELFVRARTRGLADNHEMPLPLTQSQIGDAMGLTQVHVSRILTELRRENLIAIEHRHLRVVDADGLVRAASAKEADLARLAAGQRLWP